MRALLRPARLGAVLCAVFAPVSCGSSDAPPAADPNASVEETLWEIPPTPGPVSLAIDGEPLPPFVVEEFLTGEWSAWFMRQENPATGEDAAALFFARPDELFAPLVRDWLLLREDRTRHPEAIDPEAFAAYRAGFEQRLGATAAQLAGRLGEDALTAHLERQFRVQRILREFGVGAGPITVADIEQRYAERLEELRASGEFSEEELAGAPTLDEPRLRAGIEAELARERGDEVVVDWLTDLLPVTVVEFTDLTGEVHVLDVRPRSPAGPDRQE